MSGFRPVTPHLSRMVAASILAGVLVLGGMAIAKEPVEKAKPSAMDGAGDMAQVVGSQRAYVNWSATGLNNGTSWTDAYTRLQDALTAAVPGDEVWVAAGIYKPDQGAGITPGDRTAKFQLQSGVALYGGFDGTETQLNQRNPLINTAVLSGDLGGDDALVSCVTDSNCGTDKRCLDGFCLENGNNGENSYHVVSGSGTDTTAILDGFTITAGNANGVAIEDSRGGGMSTTSGGPLVTNCAFDRNASSSSGAGMANFSSSTIATNCIFSRNSTGNGGGGGMNNNSGSAVEVAGCSFYGNWSKGAGGGAGGGLRYLNSSSGTNINCVFVRNSSSSGGGISITNSSSPTVINASFSGNTATSGGAIQIAVSSSPILTNCTISNNSANGNGGGIFSNNGGTNPTCTNCIVWGNNDSGGMDESAQIHAANGAIPSVNFSIVQGGWSGAGGTAVLSVDPLFFDPDGADNAIGTNDDDLRLRAGSPAIDAGNNASVPADTLDLDGDLNVAEPIPFDLAGNARLVGTVDMGAYEYFPDCNNNGIDDATDIAGPTSNDCNSAGWPSNGIPDECDIAACSGDPGCDDCNINGVIDGCDISSMTSMDMNMNGVPDECCAFVGGCAAGSIVWSCFDNWDLPGNVYPDSATFIGMHPAVTLDQADEVLLDVDATIETMRIVDIADLSITQTGTAGDLNFTAPAQLQINGTLLIAGLRTIGSAGVPPEVTVGAAGIYKASGAVAAGVVSASLTATSLSVVGSDCLIPPCPDGGQITLTESMSLTTIGNFTIDGSLANGECNLQSREDGHQAVLTFHTPPSVRVIGAYSQLNVGSVFQFSGAAGFLLESLEPVTVGGDWMNHSVRPDCFDAANGTIRLEGTSPQTFEVAATDGGGTGASANDFRIGRLEVAADSEVILVDAFDNDLLGQASCGEAQYVDTLVLEAGSTMTVQNCRLHYNNLIMAPTAQIVVTGCGEALEAQTPAAVLGDPSGLSKARVLSFALPDAAAAGSSATALRVALVSLHHVEPPYTGGESIPFNSFEGQVRWVGAPTQYVESSASGIPFKASQLQCLPYYHDWSTVGLLHVFGSAITPSSSYRVQVVAGSCTGIEGQCTAVSTPLIVSTTRWGDAKTPYNPPDPSVQPDISDVGALVDKFRNAPGAPIKARGILAGAPGNPFGEVTHEVLNVDFGFSHISACVDAFRGVPYPYTIQACP